MHTNMQIIVYSTNTSSYSKKLKEYFHTKGLVFTEKLIDQNDLAKRELSSYNQGYMGIPFTVIQKDDKTLETVVGFDQGKIDQILSK